MNTLVSLLAFVLLCYSDTLPDRLAGKVEVRLHVNKQQFLSGEFIYIDCSVRNLLDSDVRIPLLNPRHGRKFLTLVDSRNARVPGGVIAGSFGEYPTEVLQGKSKLLRTFTLSSYGNTDSFTGIVRNLKPGLYRVWINLSDARSDTVDIRIVEPAAEDRAFAERLNTRVSNYVTATVPTAIRECKDLIRTNPNSPYLPNAYFALMSALRYSDEPQWNTIELKKVAEEYISRFSDFAGVYRGINFFTHAVQNSIGARHMRTLSSEQISVIETELRGLKERYPQTRVARSVDEKIASLDRLKDN